jgi:hypothetical protein
VSIMAGMKDVKYMGARWGDWIIKGCGGLGYGSETSISRLTTSPGRSSRQNYAPAYEPDPVARRFDNALQRIPAKLRNLIYCRFVLQLSDARMMDYDSRYRTEGQARWAVQVAMREVGKVL